MSIVVRFGCLLFAACFLALATPVIDFALGSQLAGGVVTVTRFGGPMSSATFAALGTGAIASSPGSGGFTLTVSPGNTSAATWTLTNTDTSTIFLNRILSVTMDLTLSGTSLFDAGSAPSTPGSGPGIAGVSYLSGVAIGGSSNLLVWADGSNAGDMYHAASFTLSDGGLTAGLSTLWLTDTDVVGVPEPGSTYLCLAGTMLLIALKRRCAPYRVNDQSRTK